MKFNSASLERLLALCDRREFGVERLNAQSVRRGQWDKVVLAGWLLSLARSINCERSAMRADVRQLATEALHDLYAQLEPALVKDATALQTVQTLHDFAREQWFTFVQ